MLPCPVINLIFVLDLCVKLSPHARWRQNTEAWQYCGRMPGINTLDPSKNTSETKASLIKNSAGKGTATRDCFAL